MQFIENINSFYDLSVMGFHKLIRKIVLVYDDCMIMNNNLIYEIPA